jgi:hypothetical protein
MDVFKGIPRLSARLLTGLRLSPAREIFILLLILLTFAGLAWNSLKQKSVTVDEFAHLPAGLSILRTGDFRMYPHASPLIQLLTALPLLRSHAVLPLKIGWQSRNQLVLGYEFMYANAKTYPALFLRARAVSVVLGALLIVLIWWWARALYGPASGLAAATLAAFNPTLMAHAELVTTDVGGSLALFAAVMAGWAFCRRPSWPRALLAGLVMGLALLSRLTALLLLPLWPVLVLGSRPAGETRLGWRRSAGAAAVVCFVAWITLCSGYLWRGVGTPLGEQVFESELFARVGSLWPARLPIGLPSDYLRGLDLLNKYNEETYPSYYLGRISNEPWPYYYLFALAVKTPLAALLLLVLGIGSLGRRAGAFRQEELFLVLPPLFLIAFVSWYSNMDIGLRYILPAFPFLFVLASRPWAGLFHPPVWARAGLVLLLLSNLTSNLLVYPDYLAYFNCAAGGPDRGYRLLADSNLDWGQDLIGLKQYMEKNHLNQICLAYFGRVDPRLYGIHYQFPSDPTQCEFLAVSVNFVLGLSYRVIVDSHLRWTEDNEFSWLQQEKPIATIGHSIWVFQGQKPRSGPPPPV